ncbi:hypothetical protein FH968_14805 [Buttiauxella sp. B2]|uniref:hypothetical protein n=1 Tax=Buttiauxella sp. B2 TaxID=2587812 RepID=UPI0011227798|nr:hypothetical protein [Buttiauxella sp. B2]TNV19481.1 hypothetical protein FH968_14805 [Buttiauxella sp. B2]
MKTLLRRGVMLSTLVAVCCFGLLIAINYNKTHFTCNGNIVIHGNNVLLKANVMYHFQGEEGNAKINGEVVYGNNQSTKLIQVFLFDFTRHGNTYYLKGTGATPALGNMTDFEQLKKVMNYNFLSQGSEMPYTIISMGHQVYTISNGDLPLMYCSR